MKYKKSYWSTPNQKLTHTSPIKEKVRYIFGLDYFSKKVVDIILSLPKNGKVADCGCGLGINLLRVKELRPDIIITGFDIGEHKPQGIDNFYNIDLLTLQEHEKLKESFDLVICMHVIEHINDVVEFMDNLNYIIKKDGYLYIECPSQKTLFLPGKLNFYQDPTHIRPQTKLSIKKLGIYENHRIIYNGYCYSTFIGQLLCFILLIPVLIIKFELGKFIFIRLFGLDTILISKKI